MPLLNGALTTWIGRKATPAGLLGLGLQGRLGQAPTGLGAARLGSLRDCAFPSGAGPFEQCSPPGGVRWVGTQAASPCPFERCDQSLSSWLPKAGAAGGEVGTAVPLGEKRAQKASLGAGAEQNRLSCLWRPGERPRLSREVRPGLRAEKFLGAAGLLIHL